MVAAARLPRFSAPSELQASPADGTGDHALSQRRRRMREVPIWMIPAATPGCSSACEGKPLTCPAAAVGQHGAGCLRAGARGCTEAGVRKASRVEIVHRALTSPPAPSATEPVAAAGHYPADRSGLRRHTSLSATRTAPHLPLEVSVPVPAPNRRASQRGCHP